MGEAVLDLCECGDQPHPGEDEMIDGVEHDELLQVKCDDATDDDGSQRQGDQAFGNEPAILTPL